MLKALLRAMLAALLGVAAVCNAAVALFIYGLVPEFLHRFLAWLMARAARLANGKARG